MKRLILIIASSVCIASSSLAASFDPRSAQFPPLHYQVPDSTRVVLNNGIPVHIIQDPVATVSTVSIFIRGGSLSDPPGKAGLAELLGQALRNGGTASLTPQSVDERFDAIAARLSIDFTEEYGVATVSAMPAFFPEAVTVLAELFTAPRFDADRIIVAQQQMVEAVKRVHDDPKELGTTLLTQAVYRGEPAGTVPTQKSIQSLTVDDIRQAYVRLIQAGNIVLSVSGPNSVNAVKKILTPFSALRQGSGEQKVKPSTGALSSQTQLYTVSRDISQSVIRLGMPGIRQDDPDLYASRVLNYIFGGSFTSRLMMELRTNRGLTYHVGSHFDIGRTYPGLFTIETETEASNTALVLKLINDICESLVQKTVTPQELAGAKDALINSFVFGFSSAQAVADQRARLELFNYPAGYLELYRKRISAVSVEDVQRVAQRFLKTGDYRMVVIGKQQVLLDISKRSKAAAISESDLMQGVLPSD